MTSATPPPAIHPLIDDKGLCSLQWLLHFNGLYEGDTGTSWEPTFQSLTEVGSPTITGRYYRILRRVCFFLVSVVPATNTSATAGTTYIDNFPLTFSSDGICFAVTGGLGSSSGHIIASSNRIYVPGWTAITVPLTVAGIGEVRT